MDVNTRCVGVSMGRRRMRRTKRVMHSKDMQKMNLKTTDMQKRDLRKKKGKTKALLVHRL